MATFNSNKDNFVFSEDEWLEDEWLESDYLEGEDFFDDLDIEVEHPVFPLSELRIFRQGAEELARKLTPPQEVVISDEKIPF